MIDRPSDIETLIAMLKDAADPGAAAKVMAVSGPGGFGKTTLVTQVCHSSQITEVFPDVLWVETGENCTNARVVQLISGLCVHLEGGQPALSDAEQAGFHFGRILGDRKVLLVIDNVWSAADLMPFLLGGPNTVRLITTRNARVAPARTVLFRLGPMSPVEVRELLGRSVPELHLDDAARLAALCSGWPLLASVVSSTVKTIAVWRVSGSRLLAVRRIETPSRVRSVKVSAHSALILAAGEDGTISAYSTEGLVGRAAAPATVDWIRAVCLLPGGRVLAGCEDGSIRIWEDGEFPALSEGANTTWSAAFGSSTALLGRANGTVEIRDLFTGGLSHAVPAGDGRVWDLRANPATAMAACGDGIVRLWSLRHDWTLRLNEQEWRTWAVAINRDGTRAAASSAGGRVRVWELPSGRELSEFHAHEGRIRSMAFNAAGDVLVTGGGEGIARVWRVPEGQRLAEMTRAGSWVRTVAIDAAGQRVALGCGPGDIYVHEVGAAEAAQMFGHSGRVLMIGFTEDPDVLVSAAADGTVRSWSVSTRSSSPRSGPMPRCSARRSAPTTR